MIFTAEARRAGAEFRREKNKSRRFSAVKSVLILITGNTGYLVFLRVFSWFQIFTDFELLN